MLTQTSPALLIGGEGKTREMTGLFSILAGAVGGAVIGFFGNYLLERVKRRTALNDASRKAYAPWFTAEALHSVV